MYDLFLAVGNKDDCPEKKVVITEDAQKFADQIGIKVFETSAKENLNVELVSISWWSKYTVANQLLLHTEQQWLVYNVTEGYFHQNFSISRCS